MIITFLAPEDLYFPEIDEAIGDATKPFWDSITKVYRGNETPLDAAVKRYFSIVRPVRIIPSLSSRVLRADVVICIYRPHDLPTVQPRTYYYAYQSTFPESSECPF